MARGVAVTLAAAALALAAQALGVAEELGHRGADGASVAPGASPASFAEVPPGKKTTKEEDKITERRITKRITKGKKGKKGNHGKKDRKKEGKIADTTGQIVDKTTVEGEIDEVGRIINEIRMDQVEDETRQTVDKTKVNHMKKFKVFFQLAAFIGPRGARRFWQEMRAKYGTDVDTSSDEVLSDGIVAFEEELRQDADSQVLRAKVENDIQALGLSFEQGMEFYNRFNELIYPDPSSYEWVSYKDAYECALREARMAKDAPDSHLRWQAWALASLGPGWWRTEVARLYTDLAVRIQSNDWALANDLASELQKLGVRNAEAVDSFGGDPWLERPTDQGSKLLEGARAWVSNWPRQRLFLRKEGDRMADASHYFRVHKAGEFIYIVDVEDWRNKFGQLAGVAEAAKEIQDRVIDRIRFFGHLLSQKTADEAKKTLNGLWQEP